MSTRSFTLNVLDSYPEENRDAIDVYLASAKDTAAKVAFVDEIEGIPGGGVSGWEQIRELFDKMTRIIAGDPEIGTGS
jgi:hypothetical protein